jgi:hypothetical protein
MGVAGIVLVLIISLTKQDAGKGPTLTTSCTTPAIALSTGSTGNGTNLEYAITGPASGTYVLAVDATSVLVEGKGITTSPQGSFGVSLRQGLKGCAAHSHLPNLPDGPHVLTLFRDGHAVALARLSS